MEAQEIFDTVVNHLRIQARPCREEAGCRYRLANGDGFDRCAVGVLIGDDEYEPRFEGVGVEVLILEMKRLPRLMPHILLLTHLQRAHDNWEGIYAYEGDGLWTGTDIEKSFKAVSAFHGLTYTPPEAAPLITALTGVEVKEETQCPGCGEYFNGEQMYCSACRQRGWDEGKKMRETAKERVEA